MRDSEPHAEVLTNAGIHDVKSFFFCFLLLLGFCFLFFVFSVSSRLSDVTLCRIRLSRITFIKAPQIKISILKKKNFPQRFSCCHRKKKKKKLQVQDSLLGRGVFSGISGLEKPTHPVTSAQSSKCLIPLSKINIISRCFPLYAPCSSSSSSSSRIQN